MKRPGYTFEEWVLIAVLVYIVIHIWQRLWSEGPVIKALVLVCLLSTPMYAQEPVVGWADAISWGTAAVNPTMALVDALRSDDKACHMWQLVISAGIANSAAFSLQHFVMSPRPCCRGNGWPSAHAANAGVGSSWNWRVSWAFAYATAEERERARRHTWGQALSGAALGMLSELAGQKLLRCR
jgi:hypothetical protein